MNGKLCLSKQKKNEDIKIKIIRFPFDISVFSNEAWRIRGKFA